MIICGLLTLLTGLLVSLYGLLPEWDWTIADLPTTGANASAWDTNNMVMDNVSALTGPWSMLAKTNRFLPVDHLVYIFQFFMLLTAVLVVFRVVRWIINIIRGAGA